ncbi:MAG TPA: acylphosphatase [archaeon]|nr:acylphosphatase [archaeon]
MRLEAKVFGRVQGIGYRFFASQKANSLKLKGYAKNLSDRTVEVVAEGSREQLEAFLKELQKGPPLGRVEKIESNISESNAEFKKFEIR